MSTRIKPLVLALLLVVLMAPAAFSQQRNTATSVNAITGQHTILATQEAAATIEFDTVNGAYNHAVVYNVAPSITAITVVVSARTTAGTYTVIDTVTDLGGAVRFAGDYNVIKVAYSGITGSGAINADYYGTVAVSASGVGSDVNVTNSSIPVTIGSNVTVDCASGCSGGNQDNDDNVIAGGQTTGLQLPLNYVYDGTNWVRQTIGVAGTAAAQVSTIQGIAGMTAVVVSDGSGALNTIVDSGTLTAVTTITNPVTVTDGAGALNTIVDSGTLTAVTTITNPVTVTDGAGALNTIVDSGTLTTVSTVTAVTTVTNPVTVTDGAGALNVICDSGCAGGAQYDEDTAHSSGDTTTMAGVVQQMTDAALADDGDVAVLQVDENGYLKVNVKTGAQVGVAQGSTTSGQVGTLTQGAVTTSAPSYTTAQTSPLSLDTSGNLRTLVTDGSGALNTIIDSGTVTAVTTITNPVTVTDGSGSLNVIVDSGTLTAVTSISNPVTVTDGAGALNVIVDSGTITSISNSVTVTDGAGAMNVICDSGCSGGTQYAEDAAHSSGNTVTMAGVLQKTADAAISSDGDNSLLQVDENGFLKVNIKAGAGSGGTAMTDDAAFTPATTSITPIGAEFDDSSPDSVNEGDGGVVRMSGNRNLYSTIRDAAGNERGVNVNASNQLSVSIDGGLADDAAEDAAVATDPVPAGCVYRTASVTLDNGDVGYISCDVDNAQIVVGKGTAGTAAGGVLTIQGVASMTKLLVTPDSVALPANQSVNISQINGVTTTMGNGASGTGVQRVTLASDSTGNIATIGTSVTPGTAAGNLGKAEDAAIASGDTGVAILGQIEAVPSATAANGDYGTAKLTAVGAQWVQQIGNTLKRYISAGSTEDESQVKATAGVLVGISARNANATTDAFIKCTNLTAANTTPGSSTVFYEMLVPFGGGFVDASINAIFDTALTCYIVTGKADNDATEVAANDVSYNLRYQ